MENKNNDRVPMAILSCFLIAFILQGTLKMCGIFVFEKALDWGIFSVIDNVLWLRIVYYSFIVSIAIYCLSFSLTNKPYSKKWYHYFIIISVAIINTIIKLKINITYQWHIVFDVLMYIIVPLIVNFTTKKSERLFGNSLSEVVLTISIQIALYFCFIGLGYWSGLLNSLLPIQPTLLASSTFFLIQVEVYIGIIMTMLSLNILIKQIKRR